MNTRNTTDLSRLAPRVIFRSPTKKDGSPIRSLVCASPPLTANSLSTTVMQCAHFAQTSVVAEIDGALAGFVLGYRLPQSLNTLFVLQMAVGASYRRLGLAEGMITALMRRRVHADITSLESRMTPQNIPARRVFERVAARFDAPMEATGWIESARDFLGQQPDELKVTIGPIKARLPAHDAMRIHQTSDPYDSADTVHERF
jgi:diaminobutyrate acetyltransferase